MELRGIRGFRLSLVQVNWPQRFGVAALDDLTDVKTDMYRFLLGPLGLATEVFGAFLPGCVFTILLCLKRNWTATILSYPLLGYKTKLVVGACASYIAGQMLLSLVTLTEDLAGASHRKPKRTESAIKSTQPKSPTVLDEIRSAVSQVPEAATVIQGLLAGAVAGPVFKEESGMLEHFTAFRAGTLFYLSTGLAFFIAAAIPGDGKFQLIELGISIIFLTRGIIYSRQRRTFVAAQLGVSLHDYLARIEPGKLWAAITTVVSLMLKPSNAALTTKNREVSSVSPPTGEKEAEVGKSAAP